MYTPIPVDEISIDDVVTAPPDATVMDAAALMRDERVSSVVVVRNGAPAGIVTEGDFATHLCERRDLGYVELGRVMSSPLVTVTPETSIVDAVSLLRENEIEHLPVVEGDGDERKGGGVTGSGGRVTEDESAGVESGPVDDDLVGIVTTTELSYFVPHLLRPSAKLGTRPPPRRVRTDTQYERDDWTFEYHGEDESTVSVNDVARFSKVIAESDVEAFAEVTGDTNRVHLDAGYASETRFGERIVHGVLANGLISAALARLPGLTIYLSQESTFLAPLSIGERVTAVCEVVDDLGRSKYRIRTRVLDANDEPVLEGESVVLIDELPPETVGEETEEATA